MIECGVMINWLATHCCVGLIRKWLQKSVTKNRSQTPWGERKSDWSKKALGIKHAHQWFSTSLAADSNDDDRAAEHWETSAASLQSDFLSLRAQAREDWLHLCIMSTNDFSHYKDCSKLAFLFNVTIRNYALLFLSLTNAICFLL